MIQIEEIFIYLDATLPSSAVKILFLIPYPLKESPSQRFRFEQYLEILSREGHTIRIQSFLEASDWKVFFNPGSLLRKLVLLSSGWLQRLWMLTYAHNFQVIFIHREVGPFGPPVLEWLLAKVWRKRLVFDFDDAIWTTDRKNESALLRFLKWRSKAASICRWSYRVSAGNAFLSDFARKFNSQVTINPTTVDLNHHRRTSFQPTKDFVTIGWTGSHSTLPYLEFLEPTLNRLLQIHPQTRFVVIADVPPKLNIPNLQFISWSAVTEVEDLCRIDIGIMPLPDDEWSRGKCGFKALQYMSLGIPAVVSPVGVNKEIVDDGVNGYWCSTADEWFKRLEGLLLDAGLRRRMGAQGLEKVAKRYSVDSNASNFLSLFA